MPTFLWGLCLVVAMLLLASQAATTETTEGDRAVTASPADD